MKTPAFRRNRGFTMTEIMVVLTIIVILALVAMPAFTKMRVRAIWTKTAPQMQAVLNGFHDYATDHNGYFPPAYYPQGGESDNSSGDDLSGEAKWLDRTIFGQVYPDKNALINMEEGAFNADKRGAMTGKEAASQDQGDNTSGVSGSAKGHHLRQTVFEVLASIHLNPSEQNYYNHTYCLNRKLVTDSLRAQQSKPEFSLRQRSLFPDDAATMLLVEGSEGDHNSVAPESFSQILDAAKRYDDRFVHVGFMDGHVDRVKISEFPKSHTGTDENSIFWTGVKMDAYKTFENGTTGQRKVNY